MRVAVAGTPVVRVDGLDASALPLEFREPRAGTPILTTATRTGTIVKAAKTCEYVFIGSLFNLDAMTAAARGAADDVVLPCAGHGRTVERLAEVVPV